ncbi:hypothetical protein GBAR_LOCUS17132, partial [Geodia barretti]
GLDSLHQPQVDPIRSHFLQSLLVPARTPLPQTLTLHHCLHTKQPPEEVGCRAEHQSVGSEGGSADRELHVGESGVIQHLAPVRGKTEASSCGCLFDTTHCSSHGSLHGSRHSLLGQGTRLIVSNGS